MDDISIYLAPFGVDDVVELSWYVEDISNEREGSGTRWVGEFVLLGDAKNEIAQWEKYTEECEGIL